MGGSSVGAIYRGTVMHDRKRPIAHRFTYKVFSLFLDVDRLEAAADGLRLLTIDRAGLLAFYRKDHGFRDGSALRPWVEAQLARHGRPSEPHRIMLLAMPRVFNYVFNPLSVYFCYGGDDRLQSIVYEVKNTFGGQHAYVLGAPKLSANTAFSHSCDKGFYVSPFIDMQARYHFRLREPGTSLAMAIRETDGEGCFFVASHTARRLPLRDGNLWSCWLAHSLLSLKVIGGIHWEALRLWLKGARYFPRDVGES